MRSAVSVLLLCVAGTLAFGQEQSVPERVFIDLPLEIRSENVFIRYKMITAKGSEIDLVKKKAGVHQYSFPVASQFAAKPEEAAVVVYSPGCQFKKFVIKFTGNTNPRLQFKCDKLPMKHIVGTIHPAEIPKSVDITPDKGLDIVAEFSGAWICDYFLRPRPEDPDIMIGSCLGAPVSLGIVGVLDRSKSGTFEIDIPNFRLDPTFKEFLAANYGSVGLALREKTFGRQIGVLRRSDATRIEDCDLNVSANYVEPIAFTSGTLKIGKAK